MLRKLIDIKNYWFSKYSLIAYFFTAIIVISAIIIMTIIIGSVIRRYENVQIQIAQQNAVSEVQEASLEISSHLASLNQITKDIAIIDNTLAGKPNHASEISTVLHGLLENEPNFLNAYTAYEKGIFEGRDYMMIGWYRQSGKLIPITQNLPGESYYDPGQPIYEYHKDNSWYLLAKEERKPLWGPPYFDEGGTNELIASSVCPIFDEKGKFIGVAGNDVPLGWLADITSKVKLLESGYVFVVSEDGILMTYPQRERIMKDSFSGIMPDVDFNYLKEESVKKNDGKINLVESKDVLNGEDIWLVYSSIASTNWGIIGILKQTEVLAPITRQKYFTLVFIIIGVIFIGLICWYLLRLVGKKIRAIEKVRQNNETTALRKSEERFRRAMGNIPDVVIIYDHELNIQYISEEVLRVTGRPTSDFIGKKEEEVWPNEVREVLLPPLKKAISVSTESAVEVHVNMPGVGFRNLMITYVPLNIVNEKVQELMAVIHDHTERRQAEAEIKESLNKIERTFEQTITTLGNLIEIIDPYTSGHQKKVAEISMAIAKDLGLSDETVEGIRLASLIHDIGKISIPASILSKPGVLTDIERAMIQTHPKTGYDLVKEIDFPYPIAEIILQHHERLDGSGYPNGLKDYTIMFEAKIIAVSDVFEAMSSHRPYRPAISIKTTMKELLKNKGILYDPCVIDSLVKYVNS